MGDSEKDPKDPPTPPTKPKENPPLPNINERKVGRENAASDDETAGRPAGTLPSREPGPPGTQPGPSNKQEKAPPEPMTHGKGP